jgi:hypothetical protein
MWPAGQRCLLFSIVYCYSVVLMEASSKAASLRRLLEIASACLFFGRQRVVSIYIILGIGPLILLGPR